MYLTEKQKVVLTELQHTLEKAVSVMEEWKEQLVTAQKYDAAAECKGFTKELTQIFRKIKKHNELKSS